MGDRKRQFLALAYEEFKWEYESQPYDSNPLQHCYEIIREHCPCKLYMDVEVGILRVLTGLHIICNPAIIIFSLHISTIEVMSHN